MGRGKIRVGDQEAQTAVCKVGCKDICTAWETQPVFYNNYKHGINYIIYLPSNATIGKGNGNPLQCSCLENPRDRGAWRAAVYVVAQSDTTEET